MADPQYEHPKKRIDTLTNSGSDSHLVKESHIIKYGLHIIIILNPTLQAAWSLLSSGDQQ